MAWIQPKWGEAQIVVTAIKDCIIEQVFSWNGRLGRYIKAGQYGKRMELFQQMQLEAWVLASSHLFVCSMHVLNYHLHMNRSFMVVNLMSLFSQLPNLLSASLSESGSSFVDQLAIFNMMISALEGQISALRGACWTGLLVFPKKVLYLFNIVHKLCSLQVAIVESLIWEIKSWTSWNLWLQMMQQVWILAQAMFSESCCGCFCLGLHDDINEGGPLWNGSNVIMPIILLHWELKIANYCDRKSLKNDWVEWCFMYSRWT